MYLFYPPFDFLLIIIATLSIGLLIISITGKNKPVSSSRFHKLRPYAIAFLLSSIVFTIISKELPLKFYGPTQPSSYVFDDQKKVEGPNMGAGLLAGLFYILSVIFNLVLWVVAILIIIKSISIRTTTENRDILDL